MGTGQQMRWITLEFKSNPKWFGVRILLELLGWLWRQQAWELLGWQLNGDNMPLEQRHEKDFILDYSSVHMLCIMRQRSKNSLEKPLDQERRKMLPLCASIQPFLIYLLTQEFEPNKKHFQSSLINTYFHFQTVQKNISTTSIFALDVKVLLVLV